MFLQISGLSIDVGEREGSLASCVALLLSIPEGAISSVEVLRRSLDARRSRPPRFVYFLKVRLAEGVAWRLDKERETFGATVSEEPEAIASQNSCLKTVPVFKRKPVVVGSGPAGLFAALALAERGAPVILLERGRPVPKRLLDVEEFWEKGMLNSESNVCFGEGGAGTFSDGKLTSRVKNPLAARVKRIFVECGAPAEILVDAHPHIGTDRLRVVVVNMRERLIALGGEVRFDTRLTDLLLQKGQVAGVVVNDSEEIMTSHVILAIGQSADDTYCKLANRGVEMAPKAFAVGLRVEHPQSLINSIQYGRWAGLAGLPPAEYFLTAKIAEQNRSVYSFCMCPGGSVIGSSVAAGGVVTNGMSLLKRNGPLANSAVVVNIRTEDLGSNGPLAGLAFRRHWEVEAFAAGGSDYHAPAQRLTDFLTTGKTSTVGSCSYRPGVRDADLAQVLPLFVVAALKRGFADFERKMPGFVTAEAVLVGVETRTSSPVRILRGDDGQSISIKGLFPCGEGAGYAGGIVSSALDGMKAAAHLLESGNHVGCPYL
ncbi:MAG: FAD-binding protein [Syntrophales bacterium]|jgi:hypothetical protein|nr:FAD-binding protein [Syntrophales bacterium]